MPTYEQSDMQVTIDWSNLMRVAGEVKGVPDATCRLVALDLEGRLRRGTPVGRTGQTRAGWRAEREGNGWIVGNPYAWAAYVNDGTRPHTAPFDRIKEWADFRGLPAGAVWWAIRTKGTKANPYIDIAVQETNAQVPVLFNQAVQECLT
jgi:hypothetical protein